MSKLNKDKKRSQRIRKKLKKVNTERFRLSIFRSSKNISAQIIDDINKKTLVYATSINEKNLGNVVHNLFSTKSRKLISII